MYFIRFTKENKRKLKQLEDFLHTCNLKLALDVEEFIILKDDTKIIASGGISKNVLKCIGIANEYRGKGILLNLISELINIARDEKGVENLFLYSKYENLDFFKSCGFKLVCAVEEEIVLLEHTNNLEKYKQKLSLHKKEYKKIGSIVMNANPFTLGHRHLVKYAASTCEWVHLFLVKEDASFFAFEDRLELVKLGLSDIKNLTIHEGSDYIISNATFPSYFLKENQDPNSLHAKLDALIFKNHIAPILGITHRFLGSEPFCKVTNEYNKQIKKIFYPNIEVVEIPRKAFEDESISASKVRKYLKEKNFEKIEKLVPKSTLKYLKSKES